MLKSIFGYCKGIFNTVTIANIVMGLVYFILGLIFFLNPELSNVLVSVFTGIVFIINGILSIVSYIKREGFELYNYNLIYGIVLLILGFASLFLGNILTIMLGVYYLVCGIQKINYAILLKKFEESSWLLILVTGILIMVIGIAAFFNLKDAVIAATGICLMGYGLLNIIINILLRKRSGYFIA